MYEDGGQTRDFVSVHDVTAAVLAALETPGADGSVVNIGSGIPRRIADVARTAAHISGRKDIEPDVTGQFRRGDVRHCTADVVRARRLLGFAPRVAWEDGLAELAAWARGTGAVDGFAEADRELRTRGLVSERIATRTA